MEADTVRKFAEGYAAAWCSGDPTRVASFYAEGGSLSVNGGETAVGRAAIADVAAGFMNDFPDLRVELDRLELRAEETIFHWTLFGTYAGGGASGPAVRVSGYEIWRLAPDGSAIERSLGHFDEDEYQRQLEGGR